VSALLWAGCSSSHEQTPAATPATEQPQATAGSETGGAMPATGTTGDTAEVAAVQPSMDKLKAHAADHITYPATREQVLAACAQTPEFSAGEKRWISEHLPNGTYNSSDDVMKALNATPAQ
ncbi:MAG TPA: hypothetical protein VHM19_05745, partial [Polyangiales bacterium]|nr:hypothetical protein [Polyangiales bacterium]